MKTLIFLLKGLFCMAYFSLFFKNCIHFTESYIKFSIVREIRTNNLQNAFYFLVISQLLLAAGIFFIKRRIPRIFFELLLLLYTAFISSYLIYVNYFYPGCIECSYGLSYLNETIEFTIAISLLLFGMYFIILWMQQRKNNLNIKN